MKTCVVMISSKYLSLFWFTSHKTYIFTMMFDEIVRIWFFISSKSKCFPFKAWNASTSSWGIWYKIFESCPNKRFFCVHKLGCWEWKLQFWFYLIRNINLRFWHFSIFGTVKIWCQSEKYRVVIKSLPSTYSNWFKTKNITI